MKTREIFAAFFATLSLFYTPAAAQFIDAEGPDGNLIEVEPYDAPAQGLEAKQSTVGQTTANVLRLPERYTQMNRDDFDKALAMILFKNARSASSRTYDIRGFWFEVEVVPESEINIMYVVIYKPVELQVKTSSGDQFDATTAIQVVAFNRRGDWINEVLVGYGNKDLFAVDQSYAEMAEWIAKSLRTNHGAIIRLGVEDDQHRQKAYQDIFNGRAPVFPEGERFIYKGKLFVRQGNAWYDGDGNQLPTEMQGELKIMYQRYLANLQRESVLQVRETSVQ